MLTRMRALLHQAGSLSNIKSKSSSISVIATCQHAGLSNIPVRRLYQNGFCSHLRISHQPYRIFHREFSSWIRVLGPMGFRHDTLKYAKAILGNCQDAVDNQEWFTKGGFPSNFRTTHTLLMLHIWMVHKRLLKEGKLGKQIQECLFDELWEDTSHRIRGEGIPEISVNKNLKDIQGYSFKVSIELDQALTYEDEEKVMDEMGGALWRSLYNRDDSVEEEKILALAKYFRSEQLSLLQIPKLALLEGRIRWGQLPNESDILQQSREKRKPLTSSMSTTGLSAISEMNVGKVEWREAVAPDGRIYYWHPITRESRWIKPE